ncbi:MAG TPA: class I SAM-dependent methyltransferase [Thermoanaerobaculia bacterium]|nr:class I SAM-dependent methyltransferase [Thermoanaerobaculia bacterium]
MEAPAEPLKQTIAGYWDGRSPQFERQQGIASPLQRQAWTGFLNRVIGPGPKSVLDVGTGTGFLALLASALGHTVKGLDLSPGMVEKARQLAAERGLTATFATGDAESLPEPDASYDVLINRNVIWTLPRPEKALADWQRVLKPGGTLVVVDGDWFDNPLSYRVQRFLGLSITALTTFRNPWAAEKRLRQGYDGGFDQNLPLKGPDNRNRIPRLVGEAGFADVRVLDMPVVNRAMRTGKKLVARLSQPHIFFAVTARKP